MMSKGIDCVKNKHSGDNLSGEFTHPDIAALVPLLYFVKKGF
jgi:hypothetical protein